MPIYGKKIYDEEPFNASLTKDGNWTVLGSLKYGQHGAGELMIVLQPKDGKSMDHGVRGIESGDLSPNTFYIREGTAYNVGDIGNYLWGRGMAELGIGLNTARSGAHYNNMFNGSKQKTAYYDFGPGTYNSPGVFDSEEDQQTIINCYMNSPAGKSILRNESEQTKLLRATSVWP